MRFDDDAERKIYFYRAIPQDGKPGFALDRAAVCKAMTGLKGTKDFYLDEGRDQITCGGVVSSVAPQQIKLYAVRRENLPSRDNGAGDIGDLNLAAQEGLAEAIHLRLYPNSIVAAEFFYYGPRISRFQRYLNSRLGQQVILAPLIRHDMIERALEMAEIRVLRVKINPSHMTKAKAAELNLDKLLSTAKDFHAGVYADVTLRSEGSDGAFSSRVKTLLRKLKTESPAELFENLEVQGKSTPAEHVEPINLLSDQLVRVARIPRQSARTRALDTPAAFAAIQAAYDEVKEDLTSDAVAE